MKKARLHIISAFLTGIGLGVFIATASLTPATTQRGDAYFWWAIAGFALVLAGGVVGWIARRKLVREHAAGDKAS